MCESAVRARVRLLGVIIVVKTVNDNLRVFEERRVAVQDEFIQRTSKIDNDEVRGLF